MNDLRTDRLILRQWVPGDLALFAALNNDLRVMEFFPARLSREESDVLASKISGFLERNGFGLWAVEIPNVTSFAGFVGLSIPRFTAPFTPCIEIGWRLASEHWGFGYATEGAKAALHFAFTTLHKKEIVSFTATENLRSRRVMEKLGMTRNPAEDFDHPSLSAGHHLQRHVLYRIANPDLTSSDHFNQPG